MEMEDDMIKENEELIGYNWVLQVEGTILSKIFNFLHYVKFLKKYIMNYV
jgi:hypothetical protein